MTRSPARALFTGTHIAVLALFAVEGHAQEMPVLRLGTWSGSVEVGYLNERQDTRSPDGTGDVSSERRRYTERLNVRNQGFSVVDPLLVTGNLGLTFGMLQDRFTSNGNVDSSNSRILGYAFDSTLLGAMPLSGTVFANRSQDYLTQPFSRTDSTFENHGAGLRLDENSYLNNWGIRHFSSTLRVEQQHLVESTTSDLGASSQRDEWRDILTYGGHNGFETADLDWRYEHVEFDNRAFAQGSFHSDSGNVNLSMDLGENRNRRSDTVLSYNARSGVNPTTLLLADEHVHIDHLTNLATDYRYQLTQLEAEPNRTKTQLESFQVRHELYRNLVTTGGVSATHTELAAGTRDEYAGQLNFNYRRSLAWSGTLFAGVFLREQVDENRLLSSDIAIVDEPHPAPAPLSPGAGFQLSQPFVFASSISVIDNRGGARLPTTLNVDYELVQEGNITRVVPLVTSPVIQPGDPLLISYSYEVAPSIKYRTDSRSVRAGVDFQWIAFSAGHEQSAQTLLTGQDNGFLQNMRRDNAQLDLRGTWRNVRGQTSAAYERYEATFLQYDQQRYMQLLSYRPLSTLSFTLSGDETLTNYTLPAHQTDGRSARLSADWYPGRGWTVTGQLSRRVYKDTLQPTETVTEGMVRARFDYGKFSFISTLTAAGQDRGGYQTNNWRLEFTAIRRF